MKRISLFVLTILLALLLTSCSSVRQGFVQLPDGVQRSITVLVLVAVSFAFAKLIALVPFLKFLEEFREPLALAISAALIGWIQNAVPDVYGTVAILAIQLVLAILALFGVANQLKAKRVKFFK